MYGINSISVWKFLFPLTLLSRFFSFPRNIYNPFCMLFLLPYFFIWNFGVYSSDIKIRKGNRLFFWMVRSLEEANHGTHMELTWNSNGTVLDCSSNEEAQVERWPRHSGTTPNLTYKALKMKDHRNRM